MNKQNSTCRPRDVPTLFPPNMNVICLWARKLHAKPQHPQLWSIRSTGDVEVRSVVKFCVELARALCYFVLVFFSPFSIGITSLGEERANLSDFRTFVRFVLVWFCRFPLPLGVWEGLRFVIVAFPGLFSYLFSSYTKQLPKTYSFANIYCRIAFLIHGDQFWHQSRQKPFQKWNY